MDTFPVEKETASVTLEHAPFPQAQLRSELLFPYMNAIYAELENGFMHQGDNRTRRDTREYGYSFFRMEQGDFSFSPVPKFLTSLGDLVTQSLGTKRQFFTNVILSRYEKNFCLEPHVDAHATHRFHNNFYFEENVYGLIVEADTTGHLYFVVDTEIFAARLGLHPVYSLDEHMGTIFCLQGRHRAKPYFHGVSNVTNRRISLTFRTVVIE